MVKTPPYFKQNTKYTCGPACIRMALAQTKIQKPEKWLEKRMHTNRITGTNYCEFSKIARRFGFEYTQATAADYLQITDFLNRGFVVIVCFFCIKEKYGHYAIVKKITSKKITLLDPWFGPRHEYTKKYFWKAWTLGGTIKPKTRWLFALKK